jgi:hypothetical protein
VSCDDDSGACVPGDTQLCQNRADDCRGIRTCQDNGTYGECECGNGVAGSGGGGGGGPEDTLPLIGRPCRADADCGAGLGCITANSDDFFGQGGPAGGYCTKACDDTAECQDVDEKSECLSFNSTGTGMCFRTCLTRTPPPGEEKCLGRDNLACTSEAILAGGSPSAQRETGWCLPRCSSDIECPGRVCNLTNGICQRAQLEGLPIGAACDTESDCAGRECQFTVSDTQRTCSAQCVFLGNGFQPSSCGFSSPPRGAGCAVTPTGVGDVGYCVELCATDSDCELNASLDWFCFENTGVEAVTEAPGFCRPPLPDTDAGAGDGGQVGDAATDGG